MSLDIQDPETERLVQTLAARRGISSDEAIKLAVGNESRRADQTQSLWERIRPIREGIAASPPTGLVAYKAFYDGLGGGRLTVFPDDANTIRRGYSTGLDADAAANRRLSHQHG
nr:type II toxin-antitoxin system VapB family antitoxin [Methylobacterium sp. OTU13CASTA1]